MIDYKKEVLRISKIRDIKEMDRQLNELPEGLHIGKKIRFANKTIKYSYTERDREILLHLHGLNMEKEMNKRFFNRLLMGGL